MNFRKSITYTVAALTIAASSGCSIIGGTKGITPLPAPDYADDIKSSINNVPVGSTVVVTAQGEGTNQQKAIDNAVENAVRQAVANLVSALNSYTGNNSIDAAMKKQLTEQIVLSSNDLVKKFSVTTPWSDNSNSVNLKTEISTMTLMKNKIVQDLLKSKLGYPKFAILLKDNTGHPKLNLAAHSLISQRFSKYGFEFIPGTITASYMSQVGKVPTTQLADTIYQKTGAKYLIIGNLTKTEVAKTNEGKSVQLTLDAEVIDGREKKLLTSVSESQTGTGHSAFTAEKSGLKKVLDVAFQKNKIEQDIYNIWLGSLARFEKKMAELF